MGDLSRVLLVGGGVVLALAPPTFVILALEGRVRGHPRSPSRFASAAMWSALAAYAALATCAVMNGLFAPPGPPWERLLVGLSRLPFFAQAILIGSVVTVSGSWWILRDEERHPDREKERERHEGVQE